MSLSLAAIIPGHALSLTDLIPDHVRLLRYHGGKEGRELEKCPILPLPVEGPD
jgi:hypothetical protein